MKVAYILSIVFCVFFLIKTIIISLNGKTSFDYGLLTGNLILFLLGLSLVFFLKKKLK
jgi:hypothetical protein